MSLMWQSERERERAKDRYMQWKRVEREMEKRKFKLKNIPLKTIPYSCTYIQLTVWTSKCYKTKRHSCLSSIRFNGPTEIYRTVSNSSNPDLFTLAMKNHYLLHYPFFSSFCFKWAWCRSNSLNPTMKMAKKREKKMNKKMNEKTRMKIPNIFAVWDLG